MIIEFSTDNQTAELAERLARAISDERPALAEMERKIQYFLSCRYSFPMIRVIPCDNDLIAVCRMGQAANIAAIMSAEELPEYLRTLKDAPVKPKAPIKRGASEITSALGLD